MAKEKIVFAVSTDYCNGCQACQVACREINRVPFGDTWLTVVRGKPKNVGGSTRMRFSFVPELDKCAHCIQEEEGPYCQEICPSKCLAVGLFDRLAPTVFDSDEPWAIIMATQDMEG